MKRKFLSVFGCTTSAFALSMFASFSTLASPATDTAVVETDEEKGNEGTTTNEKVDNKTESTQDEEDKEGESAQAESILDEDWSSRCIANVQNCVNIRKEPGTEHEKIGLLYKGGIAEVLEEGEEWTKIRSGSVEGYIFNKYLLFGEEAKDLAKDFVKTVATVEAAALNVRAEATTDAAVLKVVKTDQELTVIEDEQDDWVEIKLGKNVTGYVHADYVVVEEKLDEAKPVSQVVKSQTKTSVESGTQETVPVEEASVQASSNELALMAAIIQCEAGGESYEGKIAVGAVVMNRVRSSSFPNSIEGVIYQSGQFTPAASGSLANVLSQGAREDCYQAARDALNGANNVGGALYFHAGYGNGLVIGNQTFY